MWGGRGGGRNSRYMCGTEKLEDGFLQRLACRRSNANFRPKSLY